MHEIINYDETFNKDSHRSNEKNESQKNLEAYMVNNQTQNIIVPGIVSSMSTIHGQFRQDAQIKVIQKRDWQHMREKSIRDIFISNQSKEGTISSGVTQEAFMFQKEGKL